MSSIFNSGIIPLIEDKKVVSDEMKMCDYPFSIPTILCFAD